MLNFRELYLWLQVQFRPLTLNRNLLLLPLLQFGCITFYFRSSNFPLTNTVSLSGTRHDYLPIALRTGV